VDAEQVGQLVHDDDHRHAGEEAGDDRRRQKLRDPAEPQQPDQRHDHADHHREDADQVDVVGRAGRREAQDADREERRDRRVGADRHLRVGAEQREQHGAGDEGVEAGDRRHAGQARGGELLGHRDHQQRQRREQVGRRPGAL
jgi:hypothetical protein